MHPCEHKCPTFAAPIAGPAAGVVKLVDIPDLGSGAARHGGSSPSTRTEVYGRRPGLFRF